MKTAISVPDTVFEQAEREARRRHISRSEFYTRAAIEFLDRHAGHAITESYDRAFADGGGGDDEGLVRFRRKAARRLLRRTAWR